MLPEHHRDEQAGDRTDESYRGLPRRARRTAARRRPQAAAARRPVELETRQDWMAALRHETRVTPLRPAGVRPAHRADRTARATRRTGSPAGPAGDPGRGARDRSRGPARGSPASGCCSRRPATAPRARWPTASIARSGAGTRRLAPDRLTIAIATAADHWTLEDALAEAERRLSRGRRRRLVDERRQEVVELGRRVVAQARCGPPRAG